MPLNRLFMHHRATLITTAAVCSLIKIILFSFDHRVLFFFGDSQSYLYSAISSFTPADRSFFYADLLQLTFMLGAPLTIVVIMNSIASVISCVLVSYCVLLFAPSATRVACLAGIIYAVEPISVAYDGYVMTETLATLFVLGSIASGLRFINAVIETPKSSKQIFLSIFLSLSLAIAATTLRSGNLLILKFSVFLPIFLYIVHFLTKNIFYLHENKNHISILRVFLIFSAAFIFYQSAITLYSTYVAQRTNLAERGEDVGILPESGMFLAGIVLPIMTCEDLSGAPDALANPLCDRINTDASVQSRHARPGHRWTGNGALVQARRLAIEAGVPRQVATNALGHAAIHTILRDPIGFTRLGLGVWGDFWTQQYAQQALDNDRGNNASRLTGSLAPMLEELDYIIEDPETYSENFRTNYYALSLPWLRALTLAPFIGLFFLLCAPATRTPAASAFLIYTILIFSPSVFLAERTVFRYFHTLAPIVLIMLAVISSWRLAHTPPGVRRLRLPFSQRSKSRAPQEPVPASGLSLQDSAMPFTLSHLRIAVLLPCYNEEHAIGQTVRDFRSALPDAKIYVYDNNSTDNTRQVAREAGALVRQEPIQGKGAVVRRMFCDIDADIYVMADGDATYQASAAPLLIRNLIDNGADMVVGVRRTKAEAAYRPGHKFGNRLLTGLVGVIFNTSATDMLSGYRVFSKRFVKSFPSASSGFEIETELTVHAAELRMITSEVETEYYARPEGSESKLSTFQDGFKILWTILKFCRDERPFAVFGLASLFFILASFGLATPVILEYLNTGLVPRLPSAVLSSALMITGLLSLFSGLLLDSVRLARIEAKRLSFLSISGVVNLGETE